MGVSSSFNSNNRFRSITECCLNLLIWHFGCISMQPYRDSEVTRLPHLKSLPGSARPESPCQNGSDLPVWLPAETWAEPLAEHGQNERFSHQIHIKQNAFSCVLLGFLLSVCIFPSHFVLTITHQIPWGSSSSGRPTSTPPGQLHHQDHRPAAGAAWSVFLLVTVIVFYIDIFRCWVSVAFSLELMRYDVHLVPCYSRKSHGIVPNKYAILNGNATLRGVAA